MHGSICPTEETRKSLPHPKQNITVPLEKTASRTCVTRKLRWQHVNSEHADVVACHRTPSYRRDNRTRVSDQSLQDSHQVGQNNTWLTVINSKYKKECGQYLIKNNAGISPLFPKDHEQRCDFDNNSNLVYFSNFIPRNLWYANAHQELVEKSRPERKKLHTKTPALLSHYFFINLLAPEFYT
jgi:hypothetical protein